MLLRITGPESSGKTTLALQLAAALDGVYVAEAARRYLEARNGAYEEQDLTHIWAAQQEAEDSARASSASFVICDTGPEVIAVWAAVKYGTIPPVVHQAVRSRSYDLTFLCAPDLPWEADPLRETPLPEDRAALFERYRALVPDAVIIHGTARIEQALRAVYSTIVSGPR